MKNFNKFANKNVGKPGVSRRWGGGLLWSWRVILALSCCGDALSDWFPAGPCFKPFSAWESKGVFVEWGRNSYLRGDPGPFCIMWGSDSNSVEWFIPNLPEVPAEILSLQRGPAMQMPGFILSVFGGNYLSCGFIGFEDAPLPLRDYALGYWRARSEDGDGRSDSWVLGIRLLNDAWHHGISIADWEVPLQMQGRVSGENISDLFDLCGKFYNRFRVACFVGGSLGLGWFTTAIYHRFWKNTCHKVSIQKLSLLR
ncbi:MAG: hypothetical protein LBJ77_02330 [Holosporales bacterium]|nr:hypothetical protein [Holosporales bacterium]